MTRSALAFVPVLVTFAAASSATADDPDSPPPAKTILLLVNGQVLKGEVQEVDDGYVVRHKVGVIHKRRRDVQGAFESLDAAYQHIKERTPEHDPDERLKLAMWCLSQNLKEQARAELGSVMALSPENARAQAMLASLDLRGAVSPDIDQEILRTSGQEVEPPGELRGVESLRTQYARARNLGLPDIFGLPPTLALKRYQEFARAVHPELQRHCAKCHNEEFQGDFRMVAARSRRDLLDDLVLRANLDATLRLIDPDAPNRSPLLTAAGMTHGKDGKPILNGPNHPSFRIMAAWAAGLKPEASARTIPTTAAVPSSVSAPPLEAQDSTAQTEGFGVGRTNPVAETPAAIPPIPPPRIVGGTRGTIQGQAPDVPQNVQFPSSPLVDQSAQRARNTTSVPESTPAQASPAPKAMQASVQQPEHTVADPSVPQASTNPGSGTPSGMFRLPTGELVPVVSREMTLADGPAAATKASVTPPDPAASPSKPAPPAPASQTKPTAGKPADPAKAKSKNRVLNTQALEGFLKGRTR